VSPRRTVSFSMGPGPRRGGPRCATLSVMESTTDTYRAARDLLRECARDYAGAVARFSWPDFGERFNWAIDWFDAVGRGVERTALWIVEEDGSEARYSFDE